jgi:hypothetical protein
MARIIRARTPEEFYDTLRDAELSRALQAVADEMARITRPLDPMEQACAEVRQWQARKLRVVA